MRIAIVHYHLAKGGVTRVIQSTLRAMAGTSCEIVLLSSAPPEEPLEPVIVVPELAYSSSADTPQAERLEKALLTAAENHFGTAPDIWHFHNHALGKNVNLPRVIQSMAHNGIRLLLQIHDFAEDGRPLNYRAQMAPFLNGSFTAPDTALYPIAPQIIYAVLNRRDYSVLHDAGIPKTQLKWLPNPVAVPEIHPTVNETDSSARLILYPTRGIRRKNLGELLLLAALRPDFKYATTLAPRNPQWQAIHHHWDALARSLGLPVQLAYGEQPSVRFADLMHEARALITTSVAEGFGLAFLEPYLFGKILHGRNLPEITADFTDTGIALPGLYNAWEIPLEALDIGLLKSRYVNAFSELAEAYGRTAPELADRAWQGHLDRGWIDFGVLDESAQTTIIKQVVSGNPNKLTPPLDIATLPVETIGNNLPLIKSLYGLDTYRKNLLAIYGNLMEARPHSPEGASMAKVLDGFLLPDRFSLLRA
jgi:glycosyltransferase involved in cell wall biosynthesis